MNWLITGGCGFLGTSLISRLREESGHKIRVVDNLSTGTKEDLNKVCDYDELLPEQVSMHTWSEDKVQFIQGDILDVELSLLMTNSCDVIVHLAANTGVGPSVENPRIDCMTNVLGTFNYLDSARLNKVKRFIFASSGAPAGEVEPPIHEELPPHPVSPYGASKLAGEGYCSAYYKTFGIDTVALRFGNVYGPGSVHKSSVVAKFIRQALDGEVLEIFGDGSQTRDFIYIDDLISAMTLAATKNNVGGETFQIASNEETTISEITDKIIKILNARGVSGIKVVNGENRLGDVKRNYSDTSKAKKILGWSPEISQDIGLVNTVEYFLK